MLTTIGALFGVFALLVLHSYRSARLHAAAGQPFAPEGKLRWPELE